MPSLGTSYLKVSEKSRTFEAGFNFYSTCDFKEAFNRFLKVLNSVVYRLPLACDIELGAKGHVATGVLGFKTALNEMEATIEIIEYIALCRCETARAKL